MDDEQLNDEQEQLDEPQKPRSPLKKAKNAGKTVINTTINFARDAVKFFLNPAIPLPVKIVLIVVAVIIILVVVVLDAEADETASAVDSTINSYLYEENADEEGVKYFKEKASLIKFPLKDINAMYDKFMKDDQYASSTKESYKYILGTKEIKDGDNPDATTSTASMDILNMVQKAVAMAQKGGIKYGSEGRQTASNIEELDSLSKTDCSGFVWSLYKTYLNIDVGGGSDNMKTKAESKYSENGWTAEIHSIGDGELQPGDILYRDGHVGLYVGTYGEKNHVDHGGPGNGPNIKNYEDKYTKYTHYIRYTNPNSSGGGTADPNGNTAEGYQSAFTDSKNRSYKIYKQYMEPWASHSYWKGKMQKYGCGPTTLSILASGYGKNKTPANVADYMNSTYGYTGAQPLSGTLTSFLGIKNSIYYSDFESKIKDNLNAGRPVIVSVKSTPDTRFTKYSHIIIFLGIRNNNTEVFIGNVGANDSYSQKCGWNSLSGVIPYIGYIITIDSDS